MKERIRKKKTMLSALIRKQNVQLERTRFESARAGDRFFEAQATLEASTNEVNQLNSIIQDAVNNKNGLALEKLRMARHYLDIKRSEQLEDFHACLSAKQAVDAAAENLKTELLRKKGLERVFARRNDELLKLAETAGLVETDELWLRRWRLGDD